jgi:hypothetical protein
MMRGALARADRKWGGFGLPRTRSKPVARKGVTAAAPSNLKISTPALGVARTTDEAVNGTFGKVTFDV